MSINGQLDSVVSNVVGKRLESNIIEFSGYIHNKSKKIIELARFHYLLGKVAHKVNFIKCHSLTVSKKDKSVTPKSLSDKRVYMTSLVRIKKVEL